MCDEVRCSVVWVRVIPCSVKHSQIEREERGLQIEFYRRQREVKFGITKEGRRGRSVHYRGKGTMSQASYRVNDEADKKYFSG